MTTDPLVAAAAGYGLARMQYRPRLGNVALFVACVALAVAAIVGLGLPWSVAVAAALGLFLLLLQTVGRRFKRALGNEDIAFWMISQRILPPVAVVIPVYVLFQQIGALAVSQDFCGRRVLRQITRGSAMRDDQCPARRLRGLRTCRTQWCPSALCLRAGLRAARRRR